MKNDVWEPFECPTIVNSIQERQQMTLSHDLIIFKGKTIDMKTYVKYDRTLVCAITSHIESHH